tara:strand:- start:366 stop:620 length:255 start_codon:yes stop_codon:yes gene_type:complete
MVAFTKFILFAFSYSIIFFISVAINEIKNFQGFSLLFISLVLSIWIFSNYLDKNLLKGFKRNFVCICFPLGIYKPWGFFGNDKK